MICSISDDYKTIGVDCTHLAAQIEHHILWQYFFSVNISCGSGVYTVDPSVSLTLLSHIFQEFKSTDMKYKARLRSRISNLKDQKNPELRRNVLCGNISPQSIASMTAEVRLLFQTVSGFSRELYDVVRNMCGHYTGFQCECTFSNKEKRNNTVSKG